MTISLRRSSFALTLGLVVVVCAQAQVGLQSTGTPPFHSFAGGPDVIDLSNLNAHISIPVFSKAGRGTPFNYALAYDTSIWTPYTSWLPAGNWGLQRDTAALVGYVSYTYSQTSC